MERTPMRTMLVLLVALLSVVNANAVVVTCVNEGSNVVRIDYDASGETILPIAFALNVTVDGGAVIKNVYDYKVGDSNAARPGYGIFPASMKFDENGKIFDWGTPVSNGLETSGVTIGMASRYNGTANAPTVKGALCRILIDPRGAQTVNVKVAANTAAGGVVLENATVAKFTGVGCTLGASSPPPPPPPPPPPTPSGAFQQDNTADGIVSMEVEHFGNNVSQGGHSWNLITSPAGFSGSGAMRAEPDNKTNINKDYVTKSPRLDFDVNFVKTGKHYIWVRCYALNGSDNSCHAGLAGQAIKSCDRIYTSSYKKWVWTRKTLDGSRATFNVAQTGVKTVNLWMREDGFRADKIVLTTNPNYKPANTGPAESARD